ncbi:unnamed protein product [Didymodactylos carnosus]|uniref:M23ase beta-sheet core domain-containing protein n=1 Tax=Didymodactylos carnosus TaxID=1234261 RepID=A0A814R912_9BILA|nr:unnamed protein product [Didymodactylos carnosus]CAF3894493.1 unnamed protein product [Didymodactylos carnosus]
MSLSGIVKSSHVSVIAITDGLTGSNGLNSAMSRILPSTGQTQAHITSPYGSTATRRNHGGVDLNYNVGQSGINLKHPTVHSPVNGKVTFVGGQYGTIKIQDAHRVSHEILHTNSQNVRVGSSVRAGEPIGTMGGVGPRGRNQYPQHVHYQIKENNKPVNPQTWWSQNSG